MKDSLPFPREKIDSGVLWHNFGIFTHTGVRVIFFFCFLFFGIKYDYKNNYNWHILEHVQS